MKCSICNSEHCSTIDDLLDGGASQKDVAQKFQVSKWALSRHVRHANSVPALAPESGESLQAETEKWRMRSEAIWTQAVIDQDVRGQVQACQTAFRGLELAQRQEQRAAESAATTEDDDVISISEWDRLTRWWEKTQAENDEHFTKLALEEAQRLRMPDLYQVFLRLYEEPELKLKVLQFCKELFSEAEAK